MMSPPAAAFLGLIPHLRARLKNFL